jgi:hypothetical protein
MLKGEAEFPSVIQTEAGGMDHSKNVYAKLS